MKPNWRHAHEVLYERILENLLATGFEREFAQKIAREKATASSERSINKFEATKAGVRASNPTASDEWVQQETCRLERLAASYVGKDAFGKGRRLKHIRTMVGGVELARVGEKGK